VLVVHLALRDAARRLGVPREPVRPPARVRRRPAARPRPRGCRALRLRAGPPRRRRLVRLLTGARTGGGPRAGPQGQTRPVWGGHGNERRGAGRRHEARRPLRVGGDENSESEVREAAARVRALGAGAVRHAFTPERAPARFTSGGGLAG